MVPAEEAVTSIEHSKSSPYENYEVHGKVYLVDHPGKEVEIGLFVPEGVYEKTAPFEDRDRGRRVPEKEWRSVKPDAMEKKWFEVRNRADPKLSEWREVEPEKVPGDIRQKIGEGSNGRDRV